MSSLYDFIKKNHMLAIIESAAEKRSAILNLSHFEISQFPHELLDLNDMTKLYIDNNKLEALPDDLSKLEFLKVLYVDYNTLCVIPSSIGKLSNLVCLNLSHNPLGSLPHEIGLLHKLEVLWLNHTLLESLPPTIGDCILLDTLGARGNFIRVLPDEIGNLHNLRWLTLEGNLLDHLPKSMSGLSRLIHVNISNNRFETMPSLDGLKSLEYVFINNNIIQQLDVAVVESLSYIKKIDISDNPISNAIECRHIKNLKLDDKDIETASTGDEDSNSEDWEASAPTSELDVSDTSEEEIPFEDPLAAVLPQVAKFTGF